MKIAPGLPLAMHHARYAGDKAEEGDGGWFTSAPKSVRDEGCTFRKLFVRSETVTTCNAILLSFFFFFARLRAVESGVSRELLETRDSA